jgi:predicted transcriptional regulator
MPSVGYSERAKLVRVPARREALGLSQSELSERTGIHRVTIAKHETGDYPIFKPVAELMKCLYRSERRAKE